MLVCLLSAGAVEAGTFAAALESIRIGDLRKHATVLASDALEGREAGSRGGRAAGVYLVEQLKKLSVEPAGPHKRFFQEFGDDYRNILTVVPGSDPRLKDEYVLVGAHYDHVGYGSWRNSNGPIGYIHNGADDNASGTAGLLELAEAFASLEPRTKRSILFIFWDAEELGLLGSEHWLESPTIRLAQVRLLVNFDMIGRLRENTLVLYGVRTTLGLRRLFSEQNRGIGLEINFNWDIIRDSDHYPFAMRDIPYVMPYTRKHYDYHRPSDDVDKLNLNGMRQITRLLFRVIHESANRPQLAAFRAECRNENESVHRRYQTPLPPLPPRFGISWDGNLDKQHRVKLTDVVPGSPAATAGLRVGDEIVEFGGALPKEVDDFRSLVHAAQNPVSVLVERDGAKEPLKLTVHLDGTPARVGIAWRIDEAIPDGVVVARVSAGSPADRAGLKVGDHIYAVSGKNFASSDEFQRLIHASKNPLELFVERHGQIRTVRLAISQSE